MKKKILSLLLIGLIMIPNQLFAKTYQTLNLEQALTQEGIEHDLSNYKETDEQAIIYLFRGNGCGVCKKFLTFLNSIVDEYGQYFKVVSYEIYQDTNNAKLMEEVAEFLDLSVSGVPFIVIGDQAFPGYGSSYDEQIKAAIMNLYESDNRYDVIEELEKSKNKLDSSVVIIIWNFVFLAFATTIILLYSNNKHKQLMTTLEELQKEMRSIKKGQENSKETTKIKTNKR